MRFRNEWSDGCLSFSYLLTEFMASNPLYFWTTESHKVLLFTVTMKLLETEKVVIVDAAIGLRLPMCFVSTDLSQQQKKLLIMIQHGLTLTDHPVCGLEETLRQKFKAILPSTF